MKQAFSITILTIVLLFAVVAMAQPRVVVIPMGGAKHYMYWQGDWAPDTLYKVGDAVHVEGSSYMCTEEHTSTVVDAPPDATYWALIAAKGADGANGAAGTPGADGVDGTQGVKGDQGADGTQGVKGDQGDPGADGAKGDQGDPGADGAKGDPGVACWDLDGDGLCGGEKEDIDGNKVCDVADCEGPQGPAGIAPNQTCPLGSQMIGIDGTGNIICNSDYKAIVFVTSTTHNGALGGLAGADAICNTLAAAASLPGTYMAWLSDDTGSPSTRFTTQPNRKYVGIDGAIIADNWNDLIDGTLDSELKFDEQGNDKKSFIIWTGTFSDGTSKGLSCNNWAYAGSEANTSGLGFSGSLDGWWTTVGSTYPGTRDCAQYHPFYCFQQY